MAEKNDGAVKKIATREGYGEALLELGAENPNIVVLDADLAAATKTAVFKKAYRKDSLCQQLCNVCGRKSL